MEAIQFLKLMLESQASDLHLVPEAPPSIKVNGTLLPLEQPPLEEEDCKTIIYSMLTQDQIRQFENTRELDVAFTFKDIGRFRMNVYRQRGFVCAALRYIPARFLSFETLGLPNVIYPLLKLDKGLILITGPTGAGKSTTIASMVHYLSNETAGHIITIEDPIEFVHKHYKSIVSQREVGTDTDSYTKALKHVFRQNPSIIVIGEMRDMETIQAALTLAETGHLVMATLHTSDATQTVNRIIDVFPPYQQQQVRMQISFVLQAVISQKLIGKTRGIGMTLACEVLIGTPAVRNVIREQKFENLPSLIQTGAKFGMQTMNQALVALYAKQRITYQEAVENSSDPEELLKTLNELKQKKA